MPFGLIMAPFDLTKDISGTPLNLNFWRTNIELSRIRSMGCMSVSCPKWAIHETERIRRTVAFAVFKSNCPFTVPGSANNFAQILNGVILPDKKI